MNTFEVVGYLSNSRTEKTIVIEDITHEREAMDYAAMFHNIDEIISIKPVKQRPLHPVRQSWFEVDPPNGREPSDDTRYYQRVIKLPYSHWSDKVRSIANRWIESNSWRQSCYCEGDCCGCEYSRSAAWTYSAGKLTLSLIRNFNY